VATWPEFRRSTGRLAWLSHVRLLACDVEALRWIGLVAALVAVYLIGTHLSFPLADDSRVRDVVAASDLLAPMDAFLAGGATSRLGLFALGVLPLLIFYPSSLTMAGSRLRIQPRLSYGTLAALLVISALFSLWLVYLGALALAPWPLAAATAYWMLASWCCSRSRRRSPTTTGRTS